MKTQTVFTVLCTLFLLLVGVGCEDEKEDNNYTKGYIVGSFVCFKSEDVKQKTPVGFCVVLEDSTSLMNFYTFNSLDKLLNLPKELIAEASDGDNCGPIFFSKKEKALYKIKFKYRVLEEKEKKSFLCGSCVSMENSFQWKDYKEIVIEDVKLLKQ